MTTYQDIHEYIRQFQKHKRRSPFLREIQDHFGYASKGGPAKHIRKLTDKGLIERDETGAILIPSDMMR